MRAPLPTPSPRLIVWRRPMTALTTQASPGNAGLRLTTTESAGRHTTTPMNGLSRRCGCSRKPSAIEFLVTTTPFFGGTTAFGFWRGIRSLLPGPRKYTNLYFRNDSDKIETVPLGESRLAASLKHMPDDKLIFGPWVYQTVPLFLK